MTRQEQCIKLNFYEPLDTQYAGLARVGSAGHGATRSADESPKKR
jgi:hypothetical protein